MEEKRKIKKNRQGRSCAHYLQDSGKKREGDNRVHSVGAPACRCLSESKRYSGGTLCMLVGRSVWNAVGACTYPCLYLCILLRMMPNATMRNTHPRAMQKDTRTTSPAESRGDSEYKD